MDEGSIYHPRSRAAARRSRLPAPIGARPDRVALWAVFVAVFSIFVAVTTSAAQASEYRSGGITAPGSEGSPAAGPTGSPGAPEDSYMRAPLGARPLSTGMRGTDVRVLQSILRGQRYARLPVDGTFGGSTGTAVRRFERDRSLTVDGVVDGTDARALVRSMSAATATWYGPGFYGNRTACGQRLTRRTIGVAHRTLPCGTKVTLAYHGHFLTTRVIDRGPYGHNADWDLTGALTRKIGFRVTSRIRFAVYDRGRGKASRPPARRRKGTSRQRGSTQAS